MGIDDSGEVTALVGLDGFVVRAQVHDDSEALQPGSQPGEMAVVRQVSVEEVEVAPDDLAVLLRDLGDLMLDHGFRQRRPVYPDHPHRHHEVEFDAPDPHLHMRLLDPAVSRYPLAWLPFYGRRMRDLFGGDPFPFGIEENRATWEQLLLYAHQQGIARTHAKPEDIFPKGIMTDVKI